MPRRIHLHRELTTEQLKRRFRRAQEPRERSWWQILWLLAQGKTAVEVAKSTGYTHRWVGQVAKRYNEQGPVGMHNRRRTHSGHPPFLLSAQQKEELLHVLAGHPPGGATQWSSQHVADWMAVTLGRSVNRQTAWVYLRRFRHDQQLPQSRQQL